MLIALPFVGEVRAERLGHGGNRFRRPGQFGQVAEVPVGEGDDHEPRAVAAAEVLAEAVPDTSLMNAWFEMTSALTTTGATVFDPARLSDTVHLWRATMGWFGGYLILLGAYAILAPLNLGGFEVATGRVPARSGAW